MKTTEENFRLTNGSVPAKLIRRESKLDICMTKRDFIQLNFHLLKKDEVMELVNWLITKYDEME